MEEARSRMGVSYLRLDMGGGMTFSWDLAAEEVSRRWECSTWG